MDLRVVSSHLWLSGLPPPMDDSPVGAVALAPARWPIPREPPVRTLAHAARVSSAVSRGSRRAAEARNDGVAWQRSWESRLDSTADVNQMTNGKHSQLLREIFWKYCDFLCTVRC